MEENQPCIILPAIERSSIQFLERFLHLLPGFEVGGDVTVLPLDAAATSVQRRSAIQVDVGRLPDELLQRLPIDGR